MSNKMKFSIEDLEDIKKRKERLDKNSPKKMNEQYGFGEVDHDPFNEEETDEYANYFNEDSEDEDEDNSTAKSSKFMKYAGWFFGFIIVFAVVVFITIAINGRNPKVQPQQEQKQEQKQEDKKEDKKEEQKQEEKPKEDANKETEKKATKSLEKPELLANEKVTKDTTTEITKQVKYLFDEKGKFKSGSVKDILVSTPRANISTLNALVRMGYTMGDIKVYESENKGIYQFTMKFTSKDNPNNDIVWTGNYTADSGNVEFVKYYGKLPNADTSTNQVDDEKRTKD